jgi:hypothetical protein
VPQCLYLEASPPADQAEGPSTRWPHAPRPFSFLQSSRPAVLRVVSNGTDLHTLPYTAVPEGCLKNRTRRRPAAPAEVQCNGTWAGSISPSCPRITQCELYLRRAKGFPLKASPRAPPPPARPPRPPPSPRPAPPGGQAAGQGHAGHADPHR